MAPVKPAAAEAVEIDCAGTDTRTVNARIKEAVGAGRDVTLLNPAARHNLAVALRTEAAITIRGDAGYFCAGMNCGARVHVQGHCGWSVGENQESGSIRVDGDAGSCAGASMRGGLIHVLGDSGARTGIGMKGGTLVISGNAGFMTGFIFQAGRMIICGDAGDGLGDSLYEGVIYLAGRAHGLGNDVVAADITADDRAFIQEHIDALALPRQAGDFHKYVAGRQLWNFNKKDWEIWKTVA